MEHNIHLLIFVQIFKQFISDYFRRMDFISGLSFTLWVSLLRT